MSDAHRPTPAPTPTRREPEGRRRLLVIAVGLIAAFVVVVSVMIALDRDDAADLGDDPSVALDPASLEGDGVLAPAGILDEDPLDLDRASEVQVPSGEAVVVRLTNGEVAVVEHTTTIEGEFDSSTEQLDGRPVVDEGDQRGFGPDRLVPCRAGTTVVQTSDREAVQVSARAEADVRRELVGGATVADGTLTVDLPDGVEEIGRLPSAWDASARGSVSRTTDLDIIVTPLDPSAQDALSALRCPQPDRLETTRGSGEPTLPNPAGQDPRTLTVPGGELEVGLLDGETQLVVVRDEPGFALQLRPAQGGDAAPRWVSDADLARWAADVALTGPDAFADAVAGAEARRVEEMREEATGRGFEVAVTGTAGGEPWLVVAEEAADPATRPLCLVVASREHIGSRWPLSALDLASGPCVIPDPAGVLSISVRDQAVLAHVGAEVARIEVTFPDGTTATGTPVATGEASVPIVAVVHPLAPLPVTGQSATPDGTVTIQLGHGELRVDAIGPGGETVATRRFTSEDLCPAPSGC